ncbi:helix-turn-helix transcriptional regulator [Mesorhizobium sp. KR2-14]|uniref:helix-turn-helix domain-containing protein n=1 Tax=Mesorhizobium sp. KR2-14 TaxID=3156610 RepID=UPI0032B38900
MAVDDASRTGSVKEQFSKRAYRLMLQKNYNQSDLARAADMDRNRISSYMRGQSLPTGLFLKKLADALGVKPTDLIPDERLEKSAAPYSAVVSPDGKTMQIIANVFVPTQVGAQIIQLLADNATADRD